MPDDPNAPDPANDPSSDPANEPDPQGQFTPEQFQAEVEKWKALSRKNESAAKANAGAAKRLSDLEEAQKTEQQKLEDRATKAEKDLATQQLQSTRLHVALTKQLPAELAVRLQGETEEELAADADKLLELISAKGGGTVDLGQGARGNGAPSNDMNSVLRAAAGR